MEWIKWWVIYIEQFSFLEIGSNVLIIWNNEKEYHTISDGEDICPTKQPRSIPRRVKRTKIWICRCQDKSKIIWRFRHQFRNKCWAIYRRKYQLWYRDSQIKRSTHWFSTWYCQQYWKIWINGFWRCVFALF